MSLSPPTPPVPSSAPPSRAGRAISSARRLTAIAAAALAAATGLVLASGPPPAAAASGTGSSGTGSSGTGSSGTGSSGTGSSASVTTAWHDGTFALDTGSVVSRDDIVLGQPNINPAASIPLGNGALGVAAWAANGFTAQLNRSDTMPDRKSPGQVNIPGLSVISHASDFSGRLNLADGVLEESGGGESMKAWVSSAKDELIIDVSGANPNGAYFGNEQNGGADFRLRNGSGQLTVHSVEVKISGDGAANVTDFPPPVAITAPAAGTTVTTTPTVSGTSEPDATVTVDAGSSAICTATASDSGSWSSAPSAPLADGAYTLTATATDAIASPVTAPPVQVTVQG